MSVSIISPISQHDLNQGGKSNSPVIIIGNGPVGIKMANLILEKDTNMQVIIFGEESEKPYNRAQLSILLAGNLTSSQLDNPINRDKTSKITEYIGTRIVTVDREKKTVTDQTGKTFHYSKLILALGSQPIVPKIENIHISGIHQFRTIQDTNNLLESKKYCRNFYIVGSGPLGLETAFAMKTNDNHVTLQVRNNLLSKQIDSLAQKVLFDYLSNLGINIVSDNPIKKAIGQDRVNAVQLMNDEEIKCDCLIFCSGVLPNISLAQNMGLETHQGIVVDKNALSSDENIYAIGECSEHNNKTYGVVSPGFKQAKSCLKHLYGTTTVVKQILPQMHVKFPDYTTAYYGELMLDDCEYYSFSNRTDGIYRKLVIKDNHLIGAVVIGNWNEQNDVRVAVSENKIIPKETLIRFEIKGFLNEVPEQKVKDLPGDYLVCLCESVTRQELTTSIESGCRTIETLGKSTKAGTACGSCKPLLANLLDTPAELLVMRHKKAVLITSQIAILLILLTILFEPLEAAKTVQFSWNIEKLWFDHFWKLVSGYSLLALCFVAGILVLRKRWKKFSFGNLDNWRYAHSIIGLIAIFVLMIHTGVRMGSNLNFALMLVFLLATTTGSLVGVIMAKNHHWSNLKLAKRRLWWSRVHHTLLWMLPPLLGFHILGAYYF